MNDETGNAAPARDGAGRAPPEARPSSFMRFNSPAVGRLFAPLATAYDRLHEALGRSFPGRPRRILLEHHFLFFLAGSGIAILAFPRYLAIVLHLLRRGLGVSGALDTSSLPYTPNDLVAYVLLFAATYFLSARARLSIFVIASFPLGLWLSHRLDFASLGIFFGFLLAVLALIRLRPRGPMALVSIAGLSVGFMIAVDATGGLQGKAILGVATVQVALLPMLWYSRFEEDPPRRRLGLGRLLLYHLLRFHGAPVATYGEIFDRPAMPIAELRFAGLKALLVAALATWIEWRLTLVLAGLDPLRLRGAPLLLYSYADYIRVACGFVIAINGLTGVLRLFGIGLRDSFDYWILARTPNEHWRRWNMLLREWIITFVFFPIMRARRWLFAAVMASLCVSGLLHVAPQFLPGRFDTYRIGSTAAYWILNGLSIYLVIKIPNRFPRAMVRLGIGRSWAWDLLGLISTSAFYAILGYVRYRAGSWDGIVEYFGRLVQIAGA